MDAKIEEEWDCPLEWGIGEVSHRPPSSEMITTQMQQLQAAPRPWKSYILKLTLVVEYSLLKEWDKCWKYLEEFDEDLSKDGDNLVEKHRGMLSSIVSAAKLHVASHTLKPLDISQVKSSIIKKTDLNTENKVALFAVKSGVFMQYGEGGSETSKKNAEEALKLDPNEPYWYFRCGKILYRIRHYHFAVLPITSKELEYFNQFYQRNPCSESATYLALALKESGMDNISRIVKLLNEAEGNSMDDLDPRLALRLAKLWFSLRGRYDKKKVEKLFCIAENVFSNDGFFTHSFAQFLIKSGEVEKGLVYLKKSSECRNLSAWLQLQEMNYKLHKTEPSYNEVITSWDLTDNGRCMVLSHASLYYLTVGKDIGRATRFFLEAAELVPDHPYFKKLFHGWTNKGGFVNLVYKLYQNIKDDLKSNKILGEEKEFMEKAMTKIGSFL